MLIVELVQFGRSNAVTPAVMRVMEAAGESVQFMVEKNGVWEEKCIMKMKSEVFTSQEVSQHALYCKIE